MYRNEIITICISYKINLNAINATTKATAFRCTNYPIKRENKMKGNKK